MKRIFALIGLMVGTAAAVHAQSMLRVSLSDRTPITVAVDGRYFNKRGESVTVGDLPWGRHYLKIFLVTRNGRGENVQRTVYEGKIKTYKGQLTLFTYDVYNQTTVVSEQDMMNDNLPADQRQVYNNRNLNNYDQRQPDNYDNNNTQQEQPAQPANNETGYERGNQLPDGMPVASPVEPEETEQKTAKTKKTAKATAAGKSNKLDKVKTKIAGKKTDTDIMNTVKDELKNDQLTTAQVCTIMGWFNFESSKAEFAEWGYGRTTDKENFGKVKDKLSMKQYKDEIDKTIKKK